MLGCGAMGSSMLAGFVDSGLLTPNQLIISDPDPEARARAAEIAPGSTVVWDNEECLARRRVCPVPLIRVSRRCFIHS